MRAVLAGVLALPAPAWAATPRAWDFPGAELLIGAGAVVVLVVLGRALAGASRRTRERHDA